MPGQQVRHDQQPVEALAKKGSFAGMMRHLAVVLKTPA